MVVLSHEVVQEPLCLRATIPGALSSPVSPGWFIISTSEFQLQKMEKEGYNLEVVASSSAMVGSHCGLSSKWICVQLKTRGSSSTKDTDIDKQLGYPMPRYT